MNAWTSLALEARRRPALSAPPAPPPAPLHYDYSPAGARVSLSAARRVGGLVIAPALVAELHRALGVVSRPSPAYRQWQRRHRDTPIEQRPPAPSETVACSGTLADGSRWIPRHSPVAIRVIADDTSAPPAPQLDLTIELRPYQREALDRWLAVRHGVVVAPCGAGKTSLGLAAIAATPTPALILVHTLDLAQQWVDRAREQAGVTATMLGGGRADAPSRITVATLQTLATWSWEDRASLGAQFGLVVLDEAHHAPAETFSAILASLPCRHTLGLTATPKRSDGLEEFLLWSIGPIVHEIDQHHLQALGATLTPTIRWVRTGIDAQVSGDHVASITALSASEPRNELLVRLAMEQLDAGRRVLLLVERVDHAVALAGRVPGAVALVGTTPKRQRAAILAAARAGETRCVVATSLADEGLDLPELDTLILGIPSSHVGRVQQRVGRVCRPDPAVSAKAPIVFDLVDASSSARRSAQDRRRLYDRLGWPCAGLERAR